MASFELHPAAATPLSLQPIDPGRPIEPVKLISGQPGPPGIKGDKGEQGDPASVDDFDPGDLTLMFENNLI